MPIFENLVRVSQKRGGGFFLLIDPDRAPENDIIKLAEAAGDCEVDAILVGTSLMFYHGFHKMVRQIKSHTELPVIVFPGSHSQISPDADAILFTSLISSRNPQYLIDEQVKGAPLIKEFGVEPIPTGYMLIESGRYTSVQYISNSMPIPSGKSDIACAHALAAQYFGMKLIFMEAGSGADSSVPEEMIRAVSEYVDIPVMTGGGIRTAEEVEMKIASGASFVVVGNRIEKDGNLDLLRELASAAHPLEKIIV
jgi:putative glycerol-1-phosphate prenyltransferase